MFTSNSYGHDGRSVSIATMLMGKHLREIFHGQIFKKEMCQTWKLISSVFQYESDMLLTMPTSKSLADIQYKASFLAQPDTNGLTVIINDSHLLCSQSQVVLQYFQPITTAVLPFLLASAITSADDLLITLTMYSGQFA